MTDPFPDAERRPAREIFSRLGYFPPTPESLDEFQLRGSLWEFIYALAGRHFFLEHTNHLNDRQLYTWLHDDWLNEATVDIPPDSEWNCTIDLTGFSNGSNPEVWLKYFATEQERQNFQSKHPLTELPSHVNPSYDRDRWLPEPPGLPSQDGDEDPFPADEDVEELLDDGPDESDPLGLKRVDAEIRAQKRRDEKATAMHPDNWERPIEQLRRAGAPLLPTDELTDETLTAKLWELLHNLACRGFYVLSTNHLTDRQLYAELWTQGLRDEALLSGQCRTDGWFHDCIGSGSEEDIDLWLRYYATEEDRSQHAAEFPDLPMPPKETPPHNRDWRLPKGPF